MFSGIGNSPTAQLGISAAVLFLLVDLIVWILVLQRSRSRSDEDQPSASEMLTRFREIYARGGLSEEEYRTIKRKLGAELSSPSGETKSSDEPV